MSETKIQAAMAETQMAKENVGMIYRTTLRRVHSLQAEKREHCSWPTATIEELLWAIEHVCNEHDSAMELIGEIRGIAERHGIPHHASLTQWIELLAAERTTP